MHREREDLFKLYRKVYAEPSFDTKFFAMSQTEEEKFVAFAKKPLIVPKNFKHYCIVSVGEPTPIHAVYEKPVAEYGELLLQAPTWVYGEGDGLVPFNSAATPMVPEENRGGFWVVPGVGHFPAVQDDRVHKIVLGILNEQ